MTSIDIKPEWVEKAAEAVYPRHSRCLLGDWQHCEDIVVTALRAALPLILAEIAPQWRGMETAPRAVPLLFLSYLGPHAFVFSGRLDATGTVWADGSPYDTTIYTPIAWMPLPAPPPAESLEEGKP